MSRGCNVLRDVAVILNAQTESYDPIDLEKGISLKSVSLIADEIINSTEIEMGTEITEEV
jgi:hypothetical protein